MNADLAAALQAVRPQLRRAFGFGMVAALLGLTPSWYMLEVYDRVVNSRSHTTLLMLTVAVVLLYLLMEVLEWVRAGILVAAGQAFEQKLLPRIFQAAFEAGRGKAGAGSSVAMNDLRTVRELFHSPVVTATLDAPMALVALALIYAIHPLLAGVALGCAAAQVAVTLLNERATREPMNKANAGAMGAQLFSDRLLANAHFIHAMAMTSAALRRWSSRRREAIDLQLQASREAGTWQAWSKLLQNLVNSALLGLSCWLLFDNSLNGGGGMLVVSGILGGKVLTPLVQVVGQWQTVSSGREAWTRLNRLLQDQAAAAPAMPLPAPKGRLVVDRLVVTAPGSSLQLLKGISFTLAPGDVLAVVGPSAAGKTTLSRALLGLAPAASGSVRLDGVSVQTWNPAELGPHLGYLPQGVELIDGTLAENIARFGAVDLERVRAVSEAVGLDEIVAALPAGHDTRVGAGSTAISGGQRQRVALARALYGDPALVVLDEPNASLDEAGDQALGEAIRAASARGCTLVIMTHRASVLAVANRMLVISEGEQRAFGPRDEVMAALQKAQAPMRPEPVPSAPAAAQAV
ncbi:ATP-binding cassette subfamily C exporter for protease/lipase [Sphaerotilus hippei]|uniref:ATP-binding cassette subfamily C exporter for protease/lipase n=1 Tax=Sphaerotilus hippei TaxID=744406 RepID=A0A318H4K0_9BURK|nr:type I secretion system permease/ATPase [Sphaerotilus hippei]PXW94003.1 ATP-binding cassette subfamily C exporter for protease/lipase [Sphaerotilus hippei]